MRGRHAKKVAAAAAKGEITLLKVGSSNSYLVCLHMGCLKKEFPSPM